MTYDDLEFAPLQQRMKLAQMLMQQQGSPRTGWAALTNVLNQHRGRKELDSVSAEMRALADRRRAEDEQERMNFADLATAQPRPGMPNITPNDDEGNAMPSVGAETAPEFQQRRAQLARQLLMSRNPQMQQFGMQAMTPKAPETFILGKDQVRYEIDPVTRQPRQIATGPREPVGPKIGDKRDRMDGMNTIQEEFTPQGWQKFGAGPRFNPKAGTTVNVNGPKEEFKNEQQLRGEFSKASEPFAKVRDAYSTVTGSLAGDITAPATLAAATKFMKMLDPESVVRESELNMALKSTGVLDRFMNLHNVIMKGGVLTPTQVQEIQRIAGVLYNTAEGQQKKVEDYYTKLAADYNLDSSRIVRDMRGKTPSTSGWSIRPVK